MTQPIRSFSDQYAFLSNSYPSVMKFRGGLFKTAEHAFQSTKATSPSEYDLIREAKTPQEARKLGRCILLREGWIESQEALMREVLTSKFENPFLAQMLLSTHPSQILHEGTRSTYWGIVRNEGQNIFGKLLMEVRDKIREEGFL